MYMYLNILLLMMLRFKIITLLQHYTTLKNVEWEVENSY